MSVFEWILLTIALVFWTILVFAFGFGVGYTYLKDRREESQKEEKKTRITNTYALSPDQLEEVKAYVLDAAEADMEKFTGPIGLPGKDGKTPDAHDIIMYNGDNLFDWGEAIYERIKRVERRAGMSV